MYRNNSQKTIYRELRKTLGLPTSAIYMELLEHGGHKQWQKPYTEKQIQTATRELIEGEQ